MIKSVRLFTHAMIISCLAFVLGLGAVEASCIGTTTTWTGTNSNWNTAGNWDTNNIPDTAGEDVVTSGTSDLRAVTNTVGCVTVSSGRLRSLSGGYTLTVMGYQFSAPNTDTFIASNNHNLTIDMAGSSDQVVDVIDNFDRLTISNNNTVTFLKPFRVVDAFTLSGTTTTLRINGAGEFRTDQAVTIPAGVTVEINQGATWYIRNNLTVNGTLKINGGGTLRIRSGRRLIVNGSGTLQLNGASGNSAVVKSQGAANYSYVDLSGTLSASYFIFNGLRNDGLNCAGGTISSLNNGEFRFGRTGTDYITLDASCTIPATMDNVGFFDDGGFGNLNNIDAAAYSGSATTLNDWSGSVGGAGSEVDGNNVINWGTEAGTNITLTNVTRSNEPGGGTTPGEGYLTYAGLKLALSATDTLTNITEISVSMTGTASAADIEGVQLFRDTNGNCRYNDGVDTQVGTTQTMSGSPAKATFSGIAAGVLTTSSTSSVACIFIRAKISDSAADEKTVALGIQSNTDVVNDQDYIFSTTSSPPVYGNTTVINNGATSYWDGSASVTYTANNNWLGDAPTLANGRHCSIGAGSNHDPQVSSNPVHCLNATLTSSGSLDWNNTTNEFNIRGSLAVESGFTFSNASAGPGAIRMNGSSNASIHLAQAFPGHFYIENTGSAGSNIITLNGNSTLAGDLTLVDGVLSIQNGRTLTVSGNIVVQSGAELSIEAGGTLVMGDGSTLTVNSGGALNLVGSAATKAVINATGTDAWTGTINGNLNARYYTLSHLGAAGFIVNASATIDTTENLQDGSFLYPLGASPKMLVLNREIPGDSLDNMVFDDGGSTFSGSATNIDTSGIGASSDTLEIPNYSGNLSGPTYDDDPSYTINWQAATTNLKVTSETSAPSVMDAGSTYVISSLGFQQSAAGSFNDTDITSLKLTLEGTATAADISAVRTYFDSNCDDAGGVLIGTGSLSGSPASVTFTYPASTVTVASHATTPPKVCIYAEVDVAAAVTDGNTAGLRLASATDLVNSESYDLDATTPAPVSNGTGTMIASSSTTWLGGTSSDWTLGANWSSGVPDKNKDCEIPSASNNPVIASGVQACRSVNVTSGTLTINAGATLEVFQNITNTGTLAGTGQFRLDDDVTAGAHTVSSTDTIYQLTFDMPTASTVEILGSSLDITNLIIPTSQSLDFIIKNGKTLNLGSDLTLNSGILTIEGGGTLTFANGNTLAIAGGTFRTHGTADLDTSDPNNITQATANKAKIEVSGAGTWGFNATSGTVYLRGFLFDEIDANGLRIGGSANLTALHGGQLTNLSTSYASMKAIDINTTGTVTSSALKIGFQWASAPANTEAYTLVHTSGNGCGGGTITFTDFFGNWYEDVGTFDVETKNTDGNCTVTFGDSATAVALSSFTATGYDGAIALEWETSLEIDHLGFNVYRSTSDQGSLQKINTELLLNLNNYGNHRGKYRFVDQSVTNGETYYYYIEDISISFADRQMHGPVWATASSSAGPVPAPGADVNNEISDAAPSTTSDPSTIKNPSFKDLGDGVVILSQSSSSLRLKINPATPTYSASAWDNSYQDVAIKSYAETVVAGEPKLLAREILIEVYPFAETVSLIDHSFSESAESSHRLSPAPSWSVNGSGSLVASYSEDATAFSYNAFAPTSYFTLEPSLTKIGRKKFIKVTIHPIKYNAVTDGLKSLNELTLDIGLNGNSWDQNIPTSTYKVTPEVVANNLRLQYDKTGLYELTYDELVNSSVHFPFIDGDLSLLRLYKGEKELSLEIAGDSDGTFNTGDALRFYLSHEQSLTDQYNSVVLTLQDFSSGNAPLRVTSLSGDPSGEWNSDQVTTVHEVTAEENKTFVTSQSVGDGDNYFWTMISNFAGYSDLDFTMNLPHLDNTIDESVEVDVVMMGRPGVVANQDVTHHVALYVNDMSEPAEEFIFNDITRKTFTVLVDSSAFNAGSNNIRLRVLGTYKPTNDNDYVFIDKMKVRYHQTLSATGNQFSFRPFDQDVVYVVDEFTSSDIAVYDVSDESAVRKLSDTIVSSGVSHQVAFKASSDHGELHGQHYAFATGSAFLRPSFVNLTSSYHGPLHDSSRQADMVIIGHRSLLTAVDDLIAQRESQGLVVVTVEPEQIFAEFSQGIRDAEAIKRFVNYTMTSWQSPSPRYLLILGDGSSDGLDHNIGNAASGQRSIQYAATLPVMIRAGHYFDFASDSDLTSNSTFMPQISVGRLPTNSPSQLATYVNKMLAYENGERHPVIAKSVTLFQDIDYNLPDRFKERGNTLATLDSFSQANMSVETFHRDDHTAASYEAQIVSSFSDPSLWINLWGHGARDVWGDDFFFDTTFAKNLTNTRLPIVMSLSCENAYFYEDTVNEKSLGEELIFNENGGAVAFLGATAQTRPESQAKFAHSFADVLAGVASRSDTNIRIGDVFHRAQVALGTNASYRDIVRSMHIFGDPAMKLPEALFTPDPQAMTQAPTAPVAASGGGGCSASASSGVMPSSLSGLIEFLLMILLSLLPAKFLRRNK